MSGADREKDATPGHVQGMMWDLQREGYWDSLLLAGQSLGGPKWLSGKGRWVYCGWRGLVKEQCFLLAESLFWHITSPNLMYVSLANVQGFQISLPFLLSLCGIRWGLGGLLAFQGEKQLPIAAQTNATWAKCEAWKRTDLLDLASAQKANTVFPKMGSPYLQLCCCWDQFSLLQLHTYGEW